MSKKAIASEIWHINESYLAREEQRLSEVLALKNESVFKHLADQKEIILKASSATPHFTSGWKIKYEPDSIEKGSIAYIQLHGVMTVRDTWYSYGVGTIIELMQLADSHPNIEGIFLSTESGGGYSKAGNMFHAAVQALTKPIVNYTSFCASAALHATLSCDENILAGNMAEIGSIGTYVQIDLQMVEYFRKNVKTIYAKKSKLKNKPEREMEKGNWKPMQEYVDKVAEFFLEDVKEYLPNISEDALAGEMYFAEDAIKNGLADSIGNFDYAVQRLQNYIKNQT